MEELARTQADIMDFMVAYVVHTIQPDVRDGISLLNTQKQWAERLLKSKRVQAIIFEAASHIHPIVAKKVAASRPKPAETIEQSTTNEQLEEGHTWSVTNVEDFRSWHQRVTREEEERMERFHAQLNRVNHLSSLYAEEASSGADFSLYQCSAERHSEDTSRAERLVQLLRDASSNEPFIQDLRDISVSSRQFDSWQKELEFEQLLSEQMKTTTRAIAHAKLQTEKRLDSLKEQTALKVELLQAEIRQLQDTVEVGEERLIMTRCDVESWINERNNAYIATDLEVADLPSALRQLDRSESIRKQTNRKLERAQTSVTELQQELAGKATQLESCSQQLSTQGAVLSAVKDCVLSLGRAVDEDVAGLQAALQRNRLEEIRELVENLAQRVRAQVGNAAETLSPAKSQVKSRPGSKAGSSASGSPRKSRKTLKFSFEAVPESDQPLISSEIIPSPTSSKPKSPKPVPSLQGDARTPSSSSSRPHSSKLTIDTSKPIEPSAADLLDSPKSAPLQRSSGSLASFKEKMKMQVRGKAIRRNEETQMSRALLQPVTESPENQFVGSLKGLFCRYLTGLQGEKKDSLGLTGSVEGLGLDEMLNLEVETGKGRMKLGTVMLQSVETVFAPTNAPKPPQPILIRRKLPELRVDAESVKGLHVQERLFEALIEDYMRLLEAEARRRGIKRLSSVEESELLGLVLEQRIREGADDEIANYIRRQPGKLEYAHSKEALIALLLRGDAAELTAKVRRLPPKTPRQRLKASKCVSQWKSLCLLLQARQAKYLGRVLSLSDSAEVWFRMAVSIKHVKHRLLGIHSRLRSLAALGDSQDMEGTTSRVFAVPIEPQTARSSAVMPESATVRRKVKRRVESFDEERMKTLLPGLSSGGLSWNTWKRS